MNILVTGSIAYDIIMDFPGNFSDNIDPTKLHILNISFLVESLKKERGGTASNIAYNLALLKTPVSVLGLAGMDFTDLETHLNSVGVDTKNVQILKNESTGMSFMITDQKDNQISAFYPGALKYPEKLSIKKIKPKPDFVIISPNHPQAMVNLTHECRNLKIPYLYDPGRQITSLTNEQLLESIKGAKILITNDYENGQIKKRLGLTDKKLLEFAEIAITTLGEKGSRIATKEKIIEVGVAKPKNTSDPTGAGDAFTAGFIAGFLKNLDLETCAKMGAVASCYTVEKYGTTTHRFSINQFKKRFKENFDKTLSF